MMDEELKQVYELLNNEILWICLRWQIFKQIFGTSKENIELLNEFAPVIFRIFQDASYDEIILSINRLLDPPSTYGKNNLTLSRLLLMVGERDYKEFHKELEHIYKEIKSKSKEIREQRGKRIGHNDLVSIKSNFEFLPGISRNMVDDILADIYSFMNKVLGYFDESECYYNFLGPEGEDGERLINHFKQLKDYYSKKQNANKEKPRKAT